MISTLLAVGIWMSSPGLCAPGDSPRQPRVGSGSESAVTVPTPTPTPTTAHTKRRSSLKVEWFGLRAWAGLSWEQYYFLMMGGEISLFTLVWRHFYWEIVRVGGHIPYGIHWGAAMGYPFRIGGLERHQIRLVSVGSGGG